MGKFDKLYASMPVSIQNAMVSTYGIYWYWLRFGGQYAERVKAYHLRGRYSQDQWDAYQKKALQELLSVSVYHVPYYRDTWTDEQKSAALAGELQSLPLL